MTQTPLLSLNQGMVDRQSCKIRFPDLRLNKAEKLGLYGVSGCGKSTLAATLLDQVKLIQGELIKSETLKVNAKQSNPIQWIIQQPEQAFNPRLTIGQSLAESWKGRNFSDLLPLLDVDDLTFNRWQSSKPNTLSGGELQRINILRALIPETKLLICDEITAQLDMLTQQKVWQQLLAITEKRQLTLLVISHDRYLLDAVCDRVQAFSSD